MRPAPSLFLYWPHERRFGTKHVRGRTASQILGHWEFPDGVVGTIAEPESVHIALSEPGEWQGHRRMLKGRQGIIVAYYVVFDEPTDDGSGDGPCLGGEIESECLRPISV